MPKRTSAAQDAYFRNTGDVWPVIITSRKCARIGAASTPPAGNSNPAMARLGGEYSCPHMSIGGLAYCFSKVRIFPVRRQEKWPNDIRGQENRFANREDALYEFAVSYRPGSAGGLDGAKK